MIRILQISDTHLFAHPTHTLLGVNTEKSLLAVLNHIAHAHLMADICLLTGDLAQDETVLAYERLATHLAFLSCPIYWIPGNHDDPAGMERTFGRTSLRPEKYLSIRNWRILLLNTHKDKAVEGYLAKEALQDLDLQLQQASHHHVLIVLHHPPVRVGSDWLDHLGLQNAEDFLAIVDRHPHIRAIICGHVHQEATIVRNHIPYFTSPSTCVQFMPNSPGFSVDTTAFPGYRYITLFDDGTLQSQVYRATNCTERAEPHATGY